MSEKSLTLRLALLVVIVFVAAAPVSSQASYPSIVQTVTDQSNAGLVGATVTLPNVGTGERYRSKFGTGGNYQFLNLVPAAQASQIQTGGNPATNPADAQLINDVPNVTQNFFLRHAAERRPPGSETSTSTLGDL